MAELPPRNAEFDRATLKANLIAALRNLEQYFGQLGIDSVVGGPVGSTGTKASPSDIITLNLDSALLNPNAIQLLFFTHDGIFDYRVNGLVRGSDGKNKPASAQILEQRIRQGLGLPTDGG